VNDDEIEDTLSGLGKAGASDLAKAADALQKVVDQIRGGLVVLRKGVDEVARQQAVLRDEIEKVKRAQEVDIQDQLAAEYALQWRTLATHAAPLSLQ